MHRLFKEHCRPFGTCFSRKLQNFHKSYFEQHPGMTPSDLANNRNVLNKLTKK